MESDWWIIIKRDKRLKLCVLITGLGTGGAEKHLLKVLPSLKVDLFIISLTNVSTVGKELKKKGIKIYYLGLRNDLFNLPAVILKFRKIILKEKPMILNSYLIHANLFGRVFGRMFGVRKIICSVRNKHIDKPFLVFLDRITSKLVDLYLPNSNAVARFMISKGISNKKIKVIPNGIIINEFKKTLSERKKKEKREILGIKNEIIISCVANLEAQKDIKTLIKAFSKFNQYHESKLLLIGQGSLKNRLKEYSKKLKIRNNILFLGRRDDVKELLQITDIFVLPSLHEGMSNALLEAMAMGNKIITSNIEENKELIRNEKEGLTFKVSNANNLWKKLEEIYKSKTNYGKNAKKKMIKKYNIKKYIREYKKILKGI